MRQWNIRYREGESLESALKARGIDTDAPLLVQVSSGMSDPDRLENLRKEILAAMPRAEVAGMGSVLQFTEGGIEEGAVSLTVSRFERSGFTLVDASFLKGNGEEVELFLERLQRAVREDSKGVLLLTNALATDMEALVLRYRERMKLPIFGGIATAEPGVKPLLLSTHRVFEEDAAVAVLFHGESLSIRFRHLYAWDAIGKEYTVTEADGRRLVRLDGMTLMEVYTKHFGPMSREKLLSLALAHPLIKHSETFGTVSRVLLRLEGEEGLYTGAFHVGEKVQIGFGNYKKMVDCVLESGVKQRDIPTQAIWHYLCISYADPGYADLLKQSVQMFRDAPERVHLGVTFGEFGFVDGRNGLLNNAVIKVFLTEEEEARYPYAPVDLKLDPKDRLLMTLSTLVVSSGKEIMELNRYLESEVKKRTRELAQLNAMLEKKIEMEVRKSREKEKILFHQSKLAAMGEMLHNIAHQWRQPLNIIALVMQDLALKAKMGTLQPEAILLAEKKINETLNYLSETIDDFRSFAAAGEESPADARFEVKRAIHEALRLLAVLLEEEKIRLELDLPEEEIVLPGRANDLKQVLLNLVYNALDIFREREVEAPTIRVGVRTGPEVTVYVQDNGGGIDEKVIDRIFEANFTTKYHRKGSGLGLYMSRMIVRQRLGGEIVARNVHGGSLFEIRLPRKAVSGKERE